MQNSLTNNQGSRSNSGLYLPELDGLRFLAFLLVFIHHHPLFMNFPFFSFLQSHGWIGVDLFFCLSAYLLTKLLVQEYQLKRKINFKKFYIRRLFRIWPLYYSFIGLTVVFFILSVDELSEFDFLRITGLFTFLDNLFSAFHGYSHIPYTAHLWTIAFEEQFYLIIPILILILLRSSSQQKVLIFLGIFLLCNVARIVLIAKFWRHPAIWVLPFTHFESIFIGMILGLVSPEHLQKLTSPLILFLFGVVMFSLLSFLPEVNVISYHLIITYSIVGISTSSILLSVVGDSILKRFFSKRIFVFLGKRSYGLYVIHLLGIGLANEILSGLLKLPSNHLLSFCLALSITILLSIISYKYLESPFLRLKKKFTVVESRPV